MPKTRRQQAAEAAAANAGVPAEAPPEDGAPAPEPPKRKTTARKPRGKKTAEAAAAEVPQVPLSEQVAAVQAAATPVSPEAASAAAAAAAKIASPVPEDAPAAAAPNPDTSALAAELLPDALRELPEGTDADQVQQMLFETAVSLHGEGVGTDGLDDDRKAEIVSAVVMLLAPPPEEAPPEEEAPAAAAAPPPPSPAALLAEARRRQGASASASAAAAAAASPTGTEEEDSPLSPAKVLSVKVPVSEAAAKYVIEVKAETPGAVPMEASQASASQGEMSESPLPAIGVVDPGRLDVRWYPVTNAAFPEALGERFNLIFPAHRMTPISWSSMKEAHAANGETYYAFTVVDAASAYVLGQYSLVSGDPKKVIATGVINVHTNPATKLVTANILDMGTREDSIPKAGAVNPYLEKALKSMAQQLPSNAVIRYSCNQLADSEFTSRRATMHALGIPLNSYARTGLEGQDVRDALIKRRGSDELVDISNVKLRPSKTGADRVLYEYREEGGTGEVKSFGGSAVDTVFVMGKTKSVLAPRIEFVGLASSVLAEGGADRDITVPADIAKDEYKRTNPRRGGRKTTRRTRKTSSRR
jgi:hypothetical protein